MKKRVHSIEKRFLPVQLYLEDISSIISLIKAEGFDVVKIETNSGTYDDKEVHLIEESDPIKEIHSSHQFSIHIDLKYSILRASEDSTLAVGLVQKIEIILKNRKRRIVSIIKSTWFSYLIMLVWTIWVMTFINKLPKIHNDFWAQLALYGLWYMVVLLISGCITFIPFDKNIIHLQTEKELPNFWHRNKDQIIINIIIGIPVGAILGAIATLFIVWK